MAELKPRHDNELARDQVKAGAQDKGSNRPIPSKETKPHGDKLQNVFKDDDKPMGKAH